MKTELGEFLRSQWGTASPNQYGSKTNPFVAENTQRLSNGQRVPASGMGSLGQAPPIGTTPEVPVNAMTLGIPQPDCGPKMQAVIDPVTGQWTCQPAGQGGLSQLLMYGALAYFGYLWWRDRSKTRTSHRSEETDYDD